MYRKACKMKCPWEITSINISAARAVALFLEPKILQRNGYKSSRHTQTLYVVKEKVTEEKCSVKGLWYINYRELYRGAFTSTLICIMLLS